MGLQQGMSGPTGLEQEIAIPVFHKMLCFFFEKSKDFVKIMFDK